MSQSVSGEYGRPHGWFRRSQLLRQAESPCHYIASGVRRRVRTDPIARASRLRQQLTYVTLFIASCVLVGSVAAVVYNFLDGAFTLRFLLKVATVGAIAGSVFGYYLRELRAAEADPET